jgi:gluconokinase
VSPHVAAAIVLGVDIGTTSAKAVAFDVEGEVWGAAEREYPLREPAPGRVEQDAEEVVAGTLAAIREAASEARAAAAEPLALSFSGAMHSLLGVDSDGTPITPLITWADLRAAEEACRLRREHPELHGRTGTPLHPMAPLSKLCWLRVHEPRLWPRARRWVGIKELVVARLTGDWVVDKSCASGTGLFSLREEDWDAQALELARLEPDRLSRLVPADERLEPTADARAELGLGPDVTLVVGAGDGPLANLGVGAVRPGVAVCSIGTSGALRLMVESRQTDPEGRVFCYALTPGRWVVGGAVNNGGSVLQWTGEALAPDLGADPEPRLLDLAAQAPAGSDGLVMLPYLLSERAPHWSPLPRGAYVGLTQRHRRPHLVRAALEGVCQQLALVLDAMRDAGNEVRELRATGGFARSAFWRRLLADALNMPIGFPAGHEGSSFGAALVGMEALGLVPSIERAADIVEIEDVVEPTPENAELYARLRPTYEALYEALGPAFAELREQRRRS